MEEFLTLKDHVYHYIAEQINHGNLKPGEKVNENSISDKLKYQQNASQGSVDSACFGRTAGKCSEEGFCDQAFGYR